MTSQITCHLSVYEMGLWNSEFRLLGVPLPNSTKQLCSLVSIKGKSQCRTFLHAAKYKCVIIIHCIYIIIIVLLHTFLCRSARKYVTLRLTQYNMSFFQTLFKLHCKQFYPKVKI